MPHTTEEGKRTLAENNKLIAEFMGKEIWFPSWNGGQTMFNSYRTTKEDCMNLILGSQFLYSVNAEPEMMKLSYHESWDYLMPVIEKISRIKYTESTDSTQDTSYPRTFGMLSEEGQFMFRFNRYGLHNADTLIEAAYNAVIEFIEHKNELNAHHPTKQRIMKTSELAYELLHYPNTDETATEMIKAWCRLQIEKDRERVKRHESIDETPIILD